MIINRAELMVVGRLFISLYRLLRGGRSAARLVEKWARREPERTAVFFEDRRVSYRELNEWANRVANFFRSLDTKPGDVVALYMENCPEYLMVVTGLNRIGVVTSLINTHLRHQPLRHALKICNPRWVIAGASLLPAIDDVAAEVPVRREDIWVWDGAAPAGREERDLGQALEKTLASRPANPDKPSFESHVVNIYTSGTTGLPKAARVSNRRIFFSGYALGYSLARFNRQDVIYTPLPLYHSIGMFVGWGSALATGAGLGIRRRFSASDFWVEAKRFGATGATFIGEMPRFLLAQAPSPQDKDHQIRRVITVGLRANLWEEFRNRFGIEKIFEFYGATETNVGIMNVEGRPGFLGRVMPLQAAVIKWDREREAIMRNEKGRCEKVQEGEEGMLIGRVSSLLNLLGFDGYVDDEATRDKLIKGVFSSGDQFFVTGDVVKLHPDRWVSFSDRSGDTYRWKGENVSTKEVEVVLDSCADVCDVSVYGVKVPGEEGAAGMAAVVLAKNWDPDRFSGFVCQNLPHYARPLFLRICKELPMTVTMKHIKYVLRKDGFDPQKIEDPVYFFDRQEQKYKRLDEDLCQDIVCGNVKL